jgi:hypothetical protein
MPETVVGQRVDIVRMEPGRALGPGSSYATAQAVFRGQTEAGRTEHLIVYTDGTPNGNAAAQAVLATAEADYQAVTTWFGGLALPAGQEGDDQTTPRTATPVQVLIDQQAGGAYHFGCDATDIYIEPTPELANGFMVAELVEVFEAAANNGWSCGNTNGEGLSRALAGERNAGLGPLFVQTGQAWWQAGHADYVTSNAADDRDENSNGCATLFLFYLNKQLGYDWRTITTTGGATLGETYQKLTGKSGAQGFSEFIALLGSLDQGGTLNLPASGNPFPIGSVPNQPQPPTPPPTPPPTQPPTQPPPQPPTTPGDPGQPTVPALPTTGGGLAQGVLIGAIVLVIALIALVSAYALGWLAF